MRTTLVLDDDLFKRLKKKATDMDLTLKDLVEGLLRQALKVVENPSPKKYRLQWKTFKGNIRPGVQLDDRESLYDVMDNL